MFNHLGGVDSLESLDEVMETLIDFSNHSAISFSNNMTLKTGDSYMDPKLTNRLCVSLGFWMPGQREARSQANKFPSSVACE